MFRNTSSPTFTFTPSSDQSVEFSYIFAPERPEILNVVLAVTTTRNVITAYTIPSNGETGSAYAANSFGFFLDRYEMVSPGISYTHRDNPGHNALHSSQRGEFEVTHYHVNHTRQIRAHTFRQFLKTVKSAENELLDSGELAGWERLISHKGLKHAVGKFTEFQGKKARGELRGTYHASNFEFYNRHAGLVTIAEHTKCLTVHEALGCFPNNPFAPDSIRSLYPAPSPLLPSSAENSPPPVQTAGMSLGVLAGTMVALQVFGHFARRNEKAKRKAAITLENREEKVTVAPEGKEEKATAATVCKR